MTNMERNDSLKTADNKDNKKHSVTKSIIKEMVVVEGFHDKQAVDRAVVADCIMTQGSALSEQTLKMIARAQKTRGVIVFTDPDYVGERLRKIIDQKIPGCKHAFLTQAQANKGGDIGIENAQPDVIRIALSKARSTSDDMADEEQCTEYQELPWNFMLAAGLVGRMDSKERRVALADSLEIGYANGKQFWQRLNALRVTEEEVIAAMKRANLIN